MKHIVTTNTHSAERNLFAAVIHQAIDDIRNKHTSLDIDTLKGAKDAKEWIGELEPDFVAYCTILDLDPAEVRRRVWNGR